MSNTFSSNPTLPEPLNFLAGKELRTQEFSRLAELSNWNLGNSGAGPIWNQSFPEGIDLGGGSVGELVCDPVKVPYVSSLFSSYSISVLAALDEGDNLGLRLETLGGSGDVLLTSSGWYRFEAPIGSYEGTPELVQLRHLSGSGLLKAVSVEILPATSPLPTGTGIDLSSIASGEPLGYQLGHSLIESAQECQQRLRVLSAWSAVSGDSKWPNYAQAQTHGGFAYSHDGQDISDYYVYALVSNSSANAQGLRIGKGGASVNVPASITKQWISGTVSARSLKTSASDLISPSWSCAFSDIGDLWELQDDSVYASGANVKVHSITIYGR